MPVIAQKRRRRRMTFLARGRRHLQRIGPYPSLLLLLLPLLLVEPLKLLALIVAGNGHWLTGTAMLVAAYAASLLVIERLFRVLKPKLMMMGWFAKLWRGCVALRTRLLGGSSFGEKTGFEKLRRRFGFPYRIASRRDLQKNNCP